MKERVYFTLSLCLAVLALSAQLWALGLNTRSLHMRARAITGLPAEKVLALTKAEEHSHQFPFFYCTGWAFAAGGVALIVVAKRTREPVSRSVPLGLLVGYVLLQFLL